MKFRFDIGIETIQGYTSCRIKNCVIIMEDKRTETEKCNAWLRKMAAFILYIYEYGAEYYEDYEWDHSKKYVKENYAPLVTKYLKSLESNVEQRKDTILSIIHFFDAKFFADKDYLHNYLKARSQCEEGCFTKPYKIRLEDPRIFWFQKLVKEDISGVEIGRMLLTCQELGEFEIGISLGHEYIENGEKYFHSDLSVSLVNKHIEILQEELRLRKRLDDSVDMNCMDIADCRDYRKELEEESWDAMTGGMYDDSDGDIDMDKLGY